MSEVRIIVDEDCPEGSVYVSADGEIRCGPHSVRLAGASARNLLLELRSKVENVSGKDI